MQDAAQVGKDSHPTRDPLGRAGQRQGAACSISATEPGVSAMQAGAWRRSEADQGWAGTAGPQEQSSAGLKAGLASRGWCDRGSHTGICVQKGAPQLGFKAL